MILGIGSDLSDIRRIQASLHRFGDRFTHRCFTETERRRSERKPDRAASYAKRFAAKEACAKALGTGMRGAVYWRDMGVVNLPSGIKETRRMTSARMRAKVGDFPRAMTGMLCECGRALASPILPWHAIPVRLPP